MTLLAATLAIESKATAPAQWGSSRGRYEERRGAGRDALVVSRTYISPQRLFSFAHCSKIAAASNQKKRPQPRGEDAGAEIGLGAIFAGADRHDSIIRKPENSSAHSGPILEPRVAHFGPVPPNQVHPETTRKFRSARNPL
jgi:hypothetical protein